MCIVYAIFNINKKKTNDEALTIITKLTRLVLQVNKKAIYVINE